MNNLFNDQLKELTRCCANAEQADRDGDTFMLPYWLRRAKLYTKTLLSELQLKDIYVTPYEGDRK